MTRFYSKSVWAISIGPLVQECEEQPVLVNVTVSSFINHYWPDLTFANMDEKKNTWNLNVLLKLKPTHSAGRLIVSGQSV